MSARGKRPIAHIIFPKPVGWGMQTVFARGFPPLSMLVIGALVEREGWDVVLVDEVHDPIPGTVPDVAMFIVWTGRAPQAYQTAAWYRERGVPVVMGGVHPSMMPTEVLRHADCVVAGEAETVMPGLLADVLADRLQPIYHGSWQGMDLAPHVREYGHLYRRFPFGRYRPTHTHQSTRGCRFNCDFCSVIRINGRGSRHMEPERTVDELRYRTVMQRNYPGDLFVFFTDDDLVADAEYAAELFETLIKADLPVRIGGQASIGIARDPELLKLAEAAKFKALFTGFESVSRDSLIEANKKNRPHEYGELVGRLHKHGVAVEGGFIFGFDHDQPDVFHHTADFIHNIGLDTAHFTILTPLPGTGTFARLYAEGRIVDTDWSHYTNYRAVFEPANMTRQQLDEGLNAAYRRFYSKRYRFDRFRRHVGTLDPVAIMTEVVMNASWARAYSSKNRDTSVASFTAEHEDLEALLLTSQAPASEAITTAVRQAGVGPTGAGEDGEPVLVSLGRRP